MNTLNDETTRLIVDDSDLTERNLCGDLSILVNDPCDQRSFTIMDEDFSTTVLDVGLYKYHTLAYLLFLLALCWWASTV